MTFLESLEKDRENTVGTRNIRLAAIKSFFRYLEYRVPSCLDLALQVSAIPQKQADKPLIDWLDGNEMQAILDTPDTGTVAGLRDRAMLYVCYAAGLRVSELTAADARQPVGSAVGMYPHHGQGTPRTRTATVEGNEIRSQ